MGSNIFGSTRSWSSQVVPATMVSSFTASHYLARGTVVRTILAVLLCFALWTSFQVTLRQKVEDYEPGVLSSQVETSQFAAAQQSALAGEENNHRNGTESSSLISFLPIHEAQQLCSTVNLNPFPQRHQQRKVFDLFLVGADIDWAEIRINELAPVVDYFIIVESRKTFTNHSKPLYFRKHFEGKFSKFSHQIIYHVLDDDAAADMDNWSREHYQRNALMTQVFPSLLGAQKPRHGDVIIVSDTDEIPRPSTITLLRNCAFPQRVTLRSRFFLYSFQLHEVGEDWIHPQATFWSGWDTTPRPEDLRMQTVDMEIPNAAWHCTTCFRTVGEVIRKINSFSHQEWNKKEFKTPSEIVRRVKSGIDIFDRSEHVYEKIAADQIDVPGYLLSGVSSALSPSTKPKDQQEEEEGKAKGEDKQNVQKRFAHLLSRDPANANFLDYTPGNETLAVIHEEPIGNAAGLIIDEGEDDFTTTDEDSVLTNVM